MARESIPEIEALKPTKSKSAPNKANPTDINKKILAPLLRWVSK